MTNQDLNFYPCKIQVVLEVKPQVILTCKNFCRENLTEIGCDKYFIHSLWMFVDVHFHLQCFMNKQNFRYWSEENSRQLHEQPLHSDWVTVWCAVSSHNIISPYFFENDNGRITTVISDCCTNMVTTFLTDKLATRFPHVNEAC
jgi:hypothetical protein